MSVLTVVQNGKSKKIEFEGPHELNDLLKTTDVHVSQPCGGRGVCGKCTVFVNGNRELACKYIVDSDAVVVLPKEEIVSIIGMDETNKVTENVCLCLDIGTTTLALALVSKDDKKIIKYITDVNPQRKFGADVISRIECCMEYGVSNLQQSLNDKLKVMVSKLLENTGIEKADEMFVAGNTTMLHSFFGIDCSSLGVSPYKPQFIKKKICTGESLGFKNIKQIESLPGISAFVGADIVAGLGYVGEELSDSGYSLLVDLGTNAEIVLFGKNKYYATSAAAGPCFEGANISCGMSASEGAIYSYSDGKYNVIGNKEPIGICATGLIDIISELIKKNIIDESGYMDDDFEITKNVKLTTKDIREFQLAKSAVISAIKCLIKFADITFDDIENMYVAGGFSDKLDVKNATHLGLFPEELMGKFRAVNNTSLLGTVKYSYEHNNLDKIAQQSEYVDLGKDETFSEMFFENMSF